MNRINPKKLANSHWTALQPKNKEKHFVVTKVTYHEEDGRVESCLFEAVFTKRIESIDWHMLKNSDNWQMGWR